MSDELLHLEGVSVHFAGLKALTDVEDSYGGEMDPVLVADFVKSEAFEAFAERVTDVRPLNTIPVSELCPGSKALDGINARLR